MTPMTQLIQERILRLKQEKNACILAHCYQTHDILEVADYVGDSFGLAQNASKTDCTTASTARLLSRVSASSWAHSGTSTLSSCSMQI